MASLPPPVSDLSKGLLDQIFEQCRGYGIALDEVEGLVSGDAAFAKVIKHASSFGNEADCPDTPFMDNLAVLGAECGKSAVGLAFGELAKISKKMQAARKRHNDAIQAITQMPLTTVSTGPTPSEHKAVLDKAIKQYEKERDRVKKKESGIKRQTAVETQQRILQRAACDYVMLMTSVHERRTIEFTRHLLAMYKQQQAFFEEGLRILSEMPSVDKLLDSVLEAKGRADVYRPQLSQLRTQLEQEIAACEKREKEVEKTGGSNTSGGGGGGSSNNSSDSLLGVRRSHTMSSGLGAGRRDADTNSVCSLSGLDLQTYLTDVFAAPGNDVCGDCSAPQPRWCAADVGVLLCETCAQVHKTIHSTVQQVSVVCVCVCVCV